MSDNMEFINPPRKLLATYAYTFVTWQPIDTFPQDGVGYLVCDDRSLDGCHQVVFWDDKEDESEWRLATTDGPTFHKRAFTHWMPLPKPPHSLTEVLPKAQKTL